MIDAKDYSVGSEHELFVYYGERLAESAQIARLIANLASLGMDVKGEFFEHQIEYCSPVFFDIQSWIDHLRQAYADIFREAAALGLTALPVPICGVGAGRRRLEAYPETVARFPWHHDYPAICGIHVHFGFAQDVASRRLFHHLAWATPRLAAQITSQVGVERLRLGRAFPRHGFPGTQCLTQHVELVRREPSEDRHHWFDYMWNPRVDTIEVRFVGADANFEHLIWIAEECLALSNVPIEEGPTVDGHSYEQSMQSALGFNTSPEVGRE